MKRPSLRRVTDVLSVIAVLALGAMGVDLYCVDSGEPDDVRALGFTSGPGFAQVNPSRAHNLTNTGALVESGIQAITLTSAGNPHNAVAIGSSTRHVLFDCTGGSCTINGIAGGTQGRVVSFCTTPVTANALSFQSENAGASATDRVRNMNGATQTLTGTNSCVEYIYTTDNAGANARWRQRVQVQSPSFSSVTTTASLASNGTTTAGNDADDTFLSTGPTTLNSLGGGTTFGFNSASANTANGLLTLNHGARGWDNNYAGTHLEWTEEFISNFPGVSDAFSSSVSGTAATTGIVASAGGAGARPGIGDLQAGTDATGRAGRRTTSSIYPGDWTKVTYQATLGVPNLSTATERYALWSGCWSSETSATQSNGCFAIYDEGNVATGGCNTSNLDKWQFVCGAGGTRTRVLLDGTAQDGACGAGAITTVDSPVAAASVPNTNFDHIEIEINGTTSATLKIDGTLRATLTTNLPASGTGVICGTNLLKSISVVTNRRFWLDQHRLAIDLPSARSP